MPKYPKSFVSVEYYVPGRKRRVAGSTQATSDFLAMIHQEQPSATISQLREMVADKSKYVIGPAALAVLDAHIKAGYGAYIPEWR